MLKSIFWGTIVGISIVMGVLVFLLPVNEAVDTGNTAGKVGVEDVLSDVAEEQNSFAVNNVRIFDGESVFERSTLIITDGVVDVIGGKIPDGLKVIDGSGKTIVPGFLDAHTHIYGEALTDSLIFGVTTNFDMFTDISSLNGQREKRETLRRTSQSDLFSAGMLATVPGGHGTQFPINIETISTPEDAEAWVEQRIAEGSDYIKIVYMPDTPSLPSLDRATAAALIKAAHQQGVLAVAHISTSAGAQDMLDDEIDGLVHLFADASVSPEFIAQAKEQDLFIIPTLSVLASVDGREPGNKLMMDERIDNFLTPIQRQQLRADFGAAGWSGFDLDVGLDNAKVLHDGGIRLLAGSDAPNPGTVYGATIHQEIEFLTKAGISTKDALRAATSVPADAFDVHDRGILVAGAKADFLLLDGNPLEDITTTRSINRIYKNGFEVFRETLVLITGRVLSSPTLGDFEIDLNGPDGFVWTITDDKMANGLSAATVARSVPGNAGSSGALQVTANVKAGFAFPWAGAALFNSAAAGQNGFDISDMTELSFDVRGTPGAYRAMAFSGAGAGIPPTQGFVVTEEWQTVHLSLDEFTGFMPEAFIGFAFVAGPVLGEFEYQLDNVKLN